MGGGTRGGAGGGIGGGITPRKLALSELRPEDRSEFRPEDWSDGDSVEATLDGAGEEIEQWGGEGVRAACAAP